MRRMYQQNLSFSNCFSHKHKVKELHKPLCAFSDIYYRVRWNVLPDLFVGSHVSVGGFPSTRDHKSCRLALGLHSRLESPKLRSFSPRESGFNQRHSC